MDSVVATRWPTSMTRVRDCSLSCRPSRKLLQRSRAPATPRINQASHVRQQPCPAVVLHESTWERWSTAHRRQIFWPNGTRLEIHSQGGGGRHRPNRAKEPVSAACAEGYRSRHTDNLANRRPRVPSGLLPRPDGPQDQSPATVVINPSADPSNAVITRVGHPEVGCEPVVPGNPALPLPATAVMHRVECP